jgi:glutathione synthase/RimK-type ligase-like ATP-grasp enzyme
MSRPISGELNRLIDQAISNAADALELGPKGKLGPCDIGVVLEELLSLDVATAFEPLTQLRQRLLRGEDALRQAIIRRIGGSLRSMDGLFRRELAGHRRVDFDATQLDPLCCGNDAGVNDALRTRLAERAFERVIGERVAPALKIRWPGAMSSAQRGLELPGTHTHAVVVGELIGAVGEMFPLILDAYSYDLLHHGGITINVIGVHHDWLSESGAAKRIIYYRHATRQFWETDLAEPLAIQSAQCLCLGPNETTLHQALVTKLRGCIHVNGHEVSERCGDKYRTAMLLSRAGVATPKAALLGSHMGPQEIGEKLATAGITGRRAVIVQPNVGTEGRGARALVVDSDDSNSILALTDYARELAAQGFGDVLVRERVECLRWKGASAEHVTSIRINVSWDGTAAHAESAYVQVAGHPDDAISSAGRGGFVVSLSQGAFDQLQLSAGEVSALGETAAAAVKAVMAGLNQPDGLGLFGVDCLLERRDEGSLVSVLEINARPAGLSYSDSLETREPGVTTRLFGAIAQRVQAIRQKDPVSPIDVGAIHEPFYTAS